MAQVDHPPGGPARLSEGERLAEAVRTIRATAEAAQLKDLTFDELVQLIRLVAEAGDRSDGARIERRRERARTVLAAALVAGVVGSVVGGIIAGTNPDLLLQYLSPITGFAGIAIGYFFGRRE